MKKIFCIIILHTLLTVPVYSESGASSASFLLVPVGARPAGLGGAYTALAEDAYAMHYNPAGIAKSIQQAAFSYTNYILDLNQGYFSYIHPLNFDRSVGISLNYFDMGKFDRTVITNTANPNMPASYSATGSYGAGSLAFSIGYARMLGMIYPDLYAGISIKYIHQNIDSYSGNAGAVDLGLYIPATGFPFSFGISLLNIGTNLKMQSKNDDLPSSFRIGGAFHTLSDKFTLTVDGEKVFRDDNWYFHAGGEFRVVPYFAVRVGYTSATSSGNGLRLGFGAAYQNFKIDYAWGDENDLKSIHRVSLGYEF